MEFSYCYTLNSANLKAHWDLKDTSSGQFTRTGEIEWSTYGQDVNPEKFTILSTVENSTGSHILFSTFNDSSGWTLGINNAQKLFLQVPNRPAHCFDLNLAAKNAIAFSKVGERFSLGLYDFISRASTWEDTIIKGNTESSGSFYLGGNDNYETYYSDQKLSGEVDLFVYIDQNLYKSTIDNLFNGFRDWSGDPPITENSGYLDEFKMSYIKIIDQPYIRSGSADFYNHEYNHDLIPSKTNLPTKYSNINGSYLTQGSETGVYSNYGGQEELSSVTQKVISRTIPRGELVLYDSSARDLASIIGTAETSGNFYLQTDFFKGSSVVTSSGEGRLFLGHDYVELSQNHPFVAENLYYSPTGLATIGYTGNFI